MSDDAERGSGASVDQGFQASDWRGHAPAATAQARPRRNEPSKWLLRAKPGDFAQECVRARAILNEARGVVRGLHETARDGGRINPKEMDPVVEAISASITRCPSAIPSVTRLKLRHEYTFFHSVAVCGLMVGLARQLKLNEAQLHVIGLAGLLHDIGKARIPNPVLNKPGPLNPSEFDLVREHTIRGREILMDAGDVPEIVLDVCLNHHERIDGNGYPAKKPGTQLSIHARMGAICDVYDAVTSARAYKSAWSPGEALEWMRQATGHFDRTILAAFSHMIGAFPAGSLVRLHDGRLAVVLDRSDADPLDPSVCAFFDANHQRPIAHQRIERAGKLVAGIEYAERWAIADWAATRSAILKNDWSRAG